MRLPATKWCLSLALAALIVPATANARTQIFGTASVSVSGDPGFEGLYKYEIDLAWDVDPPELDRSDIFIELEALDDSCSCVVLRFDQPAGTSDGSNCLGGQCGVTYRGKFFCTGDADSPFPQRGAAVRFHPREQDCGDGDFQADDPDACSPASRLDFQRVPQKCSMQSNGFGHFIFYSSVAPSLPRLYGDAVVFKHGDRLEVGNLFGSLPGGGGFASSAHAPVAINEFMVKPPAGESEFIEVFNTTGSPIDISKWKLIVTNGTLESDFTFPPGTILPSGGFEFTNTMTTFCPGCIGAPQGPLRSDGGPRALLVGEDFLFDEGGVIQLEDTTGLEVDRAAYGNLGGAPISCPLVVPAGAEPPPGFPIVVDGLEFQQADQPETLSVSTNRAPDGTDSGIDQNDFNIGSPTPQSANQVAAPALGGGVRLDALYVFPRNNDGDPKNESVGLFNPSQSIINLQNLHLSDGNLIQPMVSADHEVPLEPGKELTFYHGLNATISFEFEENDRMDVYEARPEGLVRVDQLGWSQLPAFFPDSCLVRVPEGQGPTGGWDWQTSGGDVNLFYQPCNLEAVPTAVGRRVPGARVSLGNISPNPARGQVSFEMVVAGASNMPLPVRVGLYDVAGRLVRYVGSGLYVPGHYRAVWDGRDAGGAEAAPGVYFARVLVGGRPTGETRPVVRIRG